MDVKEAVKSAKSYVSDLLAEEGVFNLALEEVEYDDGRDEWNITVGFTRPIDNPRNTLAAITGSIPEKRAYRIVKIRDIDQKVLSVKIREFQH